MINTLKLMRNGFSIAINEKPIQLIIVVYLFITLLSTFFLFAGDNIISLAGPLSMVLFYTIALNVLFYYRGFEQEREQDRKRKFLQK